MMEASTPGSAARLPNGPVWLDSPPYGAYSPEWLTRALSSRWPGSIVATAAADPVHIGTTNHYRLHLTYAEGRGPASIFIKAQGRFGKRLLLGSMGLLTPETELLGSAERLPIETPTVLAVSINRLKLNSLIVMEDLTSRGAAPNSVTRPFAIDRLYRGLDQLARLHGKYWEAVPPLRGVRPWRMNAGWTLLALVAGLQGLPRMRQHGVLDLLAPDLHPWNSCLWLTRRAVELSHQGPQTLLHGDTHVGNTYDLPNGEMGFVDWQCVHIGSWSRDVGYFIMCGLDVEARRRHEKELLQYYLDALGKAGGKPPVWNDAWNAYRNSPAYGLVAWISTMGAGEDYQPDAVNLRYIERFGAAYKDLETGRLLSGRG